MVVRENLVHESMRPSSAGTIRQPMVRGSENAKTAKVVEACCNFAEAIDWRFCVPSRAEKATGDRAFSMMLSENETALHVGSFIGLTVMPSKDTVELRGGCFNMYYQPATVYEEFLPLSNLSPGRLERALIGMQHRLEKYYRHYVRA